MKKAFLPLLVVFTLATTSAQNRLFDQPMQIKSFSQSVQADCFTAITFLEIEFYNPSDKEIEGLYRFSLSPTQVITAFQLELNGRYREGSIEERWKARAAYGNIVGKRMDPALLTKEYGENYRLNIYPVPAKSSRKVTITIHQTLQQRNEKLNYSFALNRGEIAQQFHLSIKITGCTTPIPDSGLIEKNFFQYHNGYYELQTGGENISPGTPVKFYFTPSAGTACIQKKDSQTYFALRLHHQLPSKLTIDPKKILVYWDVSYSSAKQNIKKEINFLTQYIRANHITQLTVVPFATEVKAAQTFSPQLNNDWINFLNSQTYDGATRMDKLNLSDTTYDVTFLFSDGFANYGSKTLNASGKPLFTVSSVLYNDVPVHTLPANSGGTFIDLNNQPVWKAIELCSSVTTRLLSVASANGKTTFDVRRTGVDSFLVFGTLSADDTLTFTYGNSLRVYDREQIILKASEGCTGAGIDRLAILEHQQLLNGYWENVLEYGLKERIVTYNTAYIVLEKAEDYIKYNIAPPKDLEEECRLQGYVTKSTKPMRQQIRQLDDYDILQNVVNAYNIQLKKYDPSAMPVSISKEDLLKADQVIASRQGESQVLNSGQSLQGNIPALSMQNNMEEVVVTGLGYSKRREVTYSVSVVQSNNLYGSNIAEVLQGRVAGLQVTEGVPGSVATIRIRGSSSMYANSQPLFILDGIPVENINDLNVNDIGSITVLKDAAATAIYGSRAANGVIIITSKKPRMYYNYNRHYQLKKMPDEDYLEEMKETPAQEKLQRYYQLRQLYANNACFYLDMAQHLFENGYTREAEEILMNAVEVSDNDIVAMTAVAYTFESWNQYDKAIEIYRQLLMQQPSDLSLHRDLAWALYQDGNIQAAVETLYAALKIQPLYFDYSYLKATLLGEMNAIISSHRDRLDISMIPASLIQPMTANLRITLGGNCYFYNMQVKEPTGQTCSVAKPDTKNGGHLETYYYSYGTGYEIRNAPEGTYRITLNYNDYYGRNNPQVVRIISFKNYGKKDQSISVQNVLMNNQSGEIEIGEVKWRQ